MKQNMCIFPGCKEVHTLRLGSTENIELALFKSLPSVDHKSLCKLWCYAKTRHVLTRHRPDAAMVNEVLSELKIHLTDSDYLCYWAQLAMLKSKNVTDTSSSSELMAMGLIERWKMTIEDEDTDHVTKAILHTVLYVLVMSRTLPE